MRINYLFVFIFQILLTSLNLSAQERCPSINLYKTKLVRDGNDSSGVLALPLNFRITADSIIVYIGDKSGAQFMAFRIMGKECKWNEDFSEGESTYKLLMGGVMDRKFPIIVITSNNKKTEVKLLYENGEIRIFFNPI
jgi:hypothetical protein